MTQFLIVYDQAAGEVIELTEYPDTERESALDARFELERRYQAQAHIEVVALGADTREDLEATHGRYFKTIAQLAEGS